MRVPPVTSHGDRSFPTYVTPVTGPVEKPKIRHREAAEGGRGDLGSHMKSEIATSSRLWRDSSQ